MSKNFPVLCKIHYEALHNIKKGVGIMDSVNSTTFIKRPPFMTDTQEKFLYTKELLSGRIFLGCYQERRHVPVLKDYRDVVILSSEETELQNDLIKLRKRWAGVTDVKWVGITGPEEFGFPKAFCLWVKLTNLAFGHYWFQIKHVKLVDEEILLQLKCIRKSLSPISGIQQTDEEESYETKDSKPEGSRSTNMQTLDFDMDFDARKAYKTLQNTCSSTINVIQPHLTFKNFVTFIRTIVAVVVVMVMGTISFMGHLGEYVLKLIREISYLVNAFTPIILQLIDFLSKIIGGFYILLAGMLYKQRNQQNMQPLRNPNMYSIPYSDVPRSSSSYVPSTDWRERNRILRQELFSDIN